MKTTEIDDPMKKIKLLLPILLLLIFSSCTAETAAGTATEPTEPIAEEILSEKAQQFSNPEQTEIFTEHAEILTDYDVNDLPVRSEQAMSDLIDALILSEKWLEEFKLICSDMVTSDQEAYYQITLNTENEYLYSRIATFWVNANSGAIYLEFDPTLDNKGYFSEFSGDIPEDDFRTRLIAFP